MRTKQYCITQNPYLPVLKKVIYYFRESPDSFTIRLDWKLEHGPGQFVFCSLPGIGEVPISICSHSSTYVELNIREVGNVTRALAKLKEGDSLLVRGPYGTTYPMKHLTGNSIIIVGGGCGVAPLKGVIEYLEKNRKDYQEVHLFFGFRTEEHTLFTKHLEDWKKLFTMHISFDKLSHGESCSLGTQGFVTQLVEQHVKSNTNVVAFLCGPPVMIDRTSALLIRKGFKKEQIFVSAERLMYCGMGKCGRCMIGGKYSCQEGAVFRLDELDIVGV